MTRPHPRYDRRGAIVPMTALMLVVLLAMVAFAVDTSWIVLTQSELQNSADAAALAGSQQLVKSYSLYSLAGQSTNNKTSLADTAAANARSVAKTYGGLNGAGGKTTLSYLDSDIEVGYTNAAGTFTAYASGGNYPNTVRVKARRDSSANSPLSLFFGPVLGKQNTSLIASATATLYTGQVNSFTYPSSTNVGMLPMTYDYSHWQAFVQTGKDPDGTTSYDSDTNPKLQIYPSVKYAGNFGQLSLNDGNVGTSTMKSWIEDGVPASDVAVLIQNKLIPLSAHDPNLWDWQGSTGFTSSLIQTVNDHVGETYWLPLFKAYNSDPSNYQAGVGKGSNYSYNIVAFVPVKIAQPNKSNRDIMVQPGSLIDAAAMFTSTSIVPAGTASSGSATTSTVIAPRLSN